MQSKFGRYLILKKIAVGGMAEIFLARRVSLGQFSKFVVLKRLAPEYQGNRSFEKLFLHEARLTGRLSHPNIVQLHDLGQVEGAYFMAMEYIHGVSSAEMMSKAAQKRKPVPLGVALQVVLSTAEALAYCGQMLSYEGESLDILHHDVSPHNIQIRFDGEIKLLDFGVATHANPQEGGGRRGKFAYMSPEAFRREPLDQRSDLFSLGVVLYELTMGRRLFKGKSQQETRLKAEACEVPPPRSIHPKFPESLEHLILRTLSKTREDRFLELRDFCKALEEVGRSLKLDFSTQRVSRYLNELYEGEIEERTLQLQKLASRADALGEQGIDDLSTIDTQERAPTNLTETPISGFPEPPPSPSSQPAPMIDDELPPAFDEPLSSVTSQRLFEAERVDDEVKADIIAAPIISHSIPSTSIMDDDFLDSLPQNFTQIAQREEDWDEERMVIQGKRRQLVSLIIAMFLLTIGAFVLGHNQVLSDPSWLGLQAPPARLNITSNPEGAHVLVNGNTLGMTPLDVEYHPREENIEVQVFKAQHHNYQQWFKIKPGGVIILDVNLKSKTR